MSEPMKSKGGRRRRSQAAPGSFEEFKARVFKPQPMPQSFDSPSSIYSPRDPVQAWFQEQRRLLVGFDDFLRQDQQNREEILLEVKEELEKWFTNGVTYSAPGSLWGIFLGFPEYENLPSKLYDILELAQKWILKNILVWKKIPREQLPELLRVSPPVSVDGNDILNALFMLKAIPILPPVKLVYETETMRRQPAKRAGKIAKVWYGLAASWAFQFASWRYQELKNEGAGAQSFQAVEDYARIEQALLGSGANELDILAFHACEAYNAAEAKEMFNQQLGIHKTEEELTEAHRNARNILIEKGIITPRLLS